MELYEIPREKNISKKHFLEQYVKPQKPVVLEHVAADWPAFQKWSLDYISETAGNREVPLFDNRPISSKYKVNEPHRYMRMKDYIELLEKGPTPYRIFLYNLLKEVPALQQDFVYPDMGLRLLKKIPMLFFGGTNAKVFMHYDIDLANILHIHFHGKKRCILFPPSQTRFLYKVPHALIAREDIDFMSPDYDKFPALRFAKGMVTELKHGDTLYMPEGYWHQMTYLSAGFSMSLRAVPRHLPHLSQAAYNLLFMRHFDNFMRRWKGQQWIDYKNKEAVRRTHRKNRI